MSIPNQSNQSAYSGTSGTISLHSGAFQILGAPTTQTLNGPSGPYKIGNFIVDISTGNLWYLSSVSASGGVTSANWIELSSGSGNIIAINGTANQVTASTTAGTTTLSTPSTFIAPGSIASTTTLTGGTGITATLGNVTVSGTGAGLVLPAGTASGTTTSTLNARVGTVTVTTPNIAAGASVTMTIANTTITGAATQVLYSLVGGTTGAALSVQSVTNSANQSAVVIQNGTGATTNTASLTLTFIVLN